MSARLDSDEPLRVVRIISRLNIGGPAIQAITLTSRLRPLGYETTLLRGREDPDEGTMDDLAQALDVRPSLLGSLRRDVGARDLLALPALVWKLRRARPHVVHTHAAKAGALGRLAALIAFPLRRPVLVHTFHGHSLTGYFSARRNAFFAGVERFLARHTDRLIAVSDEVRDELVGMGIADADRFEVVRVGFDLSPFVINGRERERRRAGLRAALGVPKQARLVTIVARLVPIKRVDRFLRMAVRLNGDPGVRFLVVGDGVDRDALRASAEARGLADRLVWTGFRRDMPDVYFASDVVVQTSDNEGTPVALIEAQAAGAPVVSTDVGGIRTVIGPVDSGHVVPVDDESALADAVRQVLASTNGKELRQSAQEHMTGRFAVERLVDDVDRLYRRLLEERQRRRVRSSGVYESRPRT
jgi:glycosyltransferase involved in cell wall biosynthesis